MNTPLSQLGRAGSDPQQLAPKTIRDIRLLPQLLAGLNDEDAATRYGCWKAVRQISEERPALLYPYFDCFAGLLNHPNKVFQWNASMVLARLAAVDTEERFAAVFEQYFAPIPGPVMITAGNVIKGGALIARAKPPLADRIAAEMLKVGKARYDTPECRNIAIGHALSALGEFCDLLSDPAPVLQFARRQLKNTRPGTRRKAELFLKRRKANI